MSKELVEYIADLLPDGHLSIPEKIVTIQRKHYTTTGGFRIFRDVRNAISREKQIKGGSRAKKNRIN